MGEIDGSGLDHTVPPAPVLSNQTRNCLLRSEARVADAHEIRRRNVPIPTYHAVVVERIREADSLVKTCDWPRSSNVRQWEQIEIRLIGGYGRDCRRPQLRGRYQPIHQLLIIQ